jgi:hypothetical protein
MCKDSWNFTKNNLWCNQIIIKQNEI